MRNSSKGFAQIIIIIILLILVGGGAYYFGTQKGKPVSQNGTTSATPAGFKTYTNTKYKYSINYPSDWTFREFPDTHTGAGFRPLNKPDDVQYEYIRIDFQRRIGGTGVTFDEYVKTAATMEIQNYKSLASIKKLVTESGLTGYETTWNVQPLMGAGGGISASLPITYFDSRDAEGDTVQVSLDNSDYESIYEEMLPTFKINP